MQAYVLTFYTIVINVMFGESTYTVSKENTSAKFTLVLSKPSATTVTVTVVNSDESAIGNFYTALGSFNISLMLQNVTILTLYPTPLHFLPEKPVFHLKFQ